MAAIIRTLPNDPGKRTRNYSDLVPPYLTREAVEWLVEKRIEHLVLDVPSLDRTHDEGHMVGHRLFFGLPPGSTRARRCSTLARHHHRAGLRARTKCPTGRACWRWPYRPSVATPYPASRLCIL